MGRFKTVILLVLLVAASFKAFASQLNACDINSNGINDAADYQAIVNMSIGITSCTANIDGTNVCDAVAIQRVVNAILGHGCLTTPAHQATLNWTASTTPNVTYNVYRAASFSGPFITPLNGSPINGTTYVDTVVIAGQTYYYVATAVDTNGDESVDSSPPVAGTIPYP